MIGVTIGKGEWREVAHWAANRMEYTTGVRCYVVGDAMGIEAAHPSWLKCWIPTLVERMGLKNAEGNKPDSFLMFDADVVGLRKWDPQGLFRLLDRPFCVVPEPDVPLIEGETSKYDLPHPDWYVNGGFAIFGREHQHVWDSVWAKHPEYGSWWEQTALNKVIQEKRVHVCRLPRWFNSLAYGGQYNTAHSGVGEPRVINMHLAGVHSAARVMEGMLAWPLELEESLGNPAKRRKL